MSELVRSETGCLIDNGDESWMVLNDGNEASFDSLGLALIHLDELLADKPTEIEILVPIEGLLEAAGSCGVESLFISTENGWGLVDDYWLPAQGLPEYGGDLEFFDLIGEFSEDIVSVGVRRWEGVVIMDSVVLEATDVEIKVLGGISDEEAVKIAKETCFELAFEHGVLYQTFLGLDNLVQESQYELPGDTELWQEHTTVKSYDDGRVACITIYRHQNNDGAQRWLVTETDSTTVIGEYPSLEELMAAEMVDDGLELFIDDRHAEK